MAWYNPKSWADEVFGTGGGSEYSGYSAKKIPTPPPTVLTQQEHLSLLSPKNLGSYEALLGQQAQNINPSKQALALMNQAKLGANMENNALRNQLSGQTASAYSNLGVGAGGARENLGMQNINKVSQGSSDIYKSLLGQQMNFMGEDVNRKQQALRDIMAQKAGKALGVAQAEAARNSGGLFGQGGFLGTGLNRAPAPNYNQY